jgi:hypothetical protein
MRDGPLWRDRNRLHAACPVWAHALALNAAIAATTIKHVDFT